MSHSSSGHWDGNILNGWLINLEITEVKKTTRVILFERKLRQYMLCAVDEADRVQGCDHIFPIG